MHKVIVIGCFVPGLAVVRALGEKKIPAVAISYSANDIAQLSRYVSEVVHIPHPQEHPEEMIDCLMTNRTRWEGALILETADLVAVPLSQHKELLSQYYRIVTPDWEILNRFLNKEVTYQLAEECGVPHPETAMLATAGDMERASQLQFPCIVKPACSFEFVNKFHVKSFVVHTPSELREKFQLCLDAGFAVLIQEIIPGPDTNLFKLHGYVNSCGEMVGKFFYQKLRQNPPGFGVMRVGISTEPNREVEQLSVQLLSHANYQGYFNSEFKRDPRDGQLKLMEVNCRMPRGGILPTASGVNFPWLIYQDLVENRQENDTKYQVGTYFIELYADLSNSSFHHKEEEITLAGYLRPYLARQKAFAELDWHDLRPFVGLTSHKVRGAWSRLSKRFRITGAPMAKSKKALIVIENNFVPLDTRVWHEACSLRDAGWKVTVICPAPSGAYQCPPAGPDGSVDLEGVRVFYFRLSAAAEGFAAYLREYTGAFLEISHLIWRVWRAEHFDTIQICNPPDIFFPVLLMYRMLGAATLYDHHDLFPEFVMRRFHGLAGKVMCWAALAMEYFTHRSAHITIEVNHSYQALAIERGHLVPERILVVRNGPRIQSFRPVPPVEALKKGFPHLVSYIGIMGYEDGIPEMFEAIRYVVKDLGRQDILFHLMGDGALRTWFLQQTKACQLDEYVEMPGMVKDRETIRKYLSTADVCLSPEPLSPLNARSSFIKVSEYMAMGKPVVAFDLKETRFTAREAAVYVPLGDTRAFGQSISDLIDSPELRAAMGGCGRERFVECLGWEHQEKALLEAYERARSLAGLAAGE